MDKENVEQNGIFFIIKYYSAIKTRKSCPYMYKSKKKKKSVSEKQ